MHMTEPKKVLSSAVISELQSSDIYLTLKARLFDLKANLNGVRVTEAFLDEIIENEAKYICHPLYADIRGLIANRKIGHMHNSRTGEFYTTQIGAFYRFEKETDGDNAYMVGYARVPKRNKAVCKALSNLFTDNALKFSFEVNCSVYEEDDDGTMVIDADEGNYWEGECVVTFPACESAVAQELIAECLNKGDDDMADNDVMNVDADISTETNVAEKETAETIYLRQEHTEIDSVHAYNDSTGEETSTRTIVETTVHTPIELAECNTENKDEEDDLECETGACKKKTDETGACKKKTDETGACKKPDDETGACKKPEDETGACKKKPDDENGACKNQEDESGSCKKRKSTAENEDVSKLIAEIRDSIDALRKEIASMNKCNTSENTNAVSASIHAGDRDVVIAENVMSEIVPVNPFMASISATKKYSLLDKEEKQARKYSLL